MYNAIFTTIKTSPHPNADRLQLGHCFGFTVVIGTNIQDSELGIFFPYDGVLSDDFCVANNLYPVFDKEGKRTGGGFIDPKNRRVRSQNFRGVKSEGFWVPLSYLDYLKLDLSKYPEGYTFTELEGKEICKKYINEATKKAIKAGKSAKIQYRETPMFPMVKDTQQFRYYSDSIRLGDKIVISEKCHGTCLKSTTAVTLLDGSTEKISSLKAGDKILGVNESGNCVESIVTNTYRYGAGQDWYTLKTLGNRKLQATETHEIFTQNRGYIPIGEVKAGDIVRIETLSLKPNTNLSSFLAGKVLGDGCLRKTKTTNKAALELGHKKEHLQYLDYCREILKPLLFLENANYKYWTSGFGTEMVSFRTQAHRSIISILENPLDFFTLESMAVLYMDDGSLSHNEKQQDRANFAICSLDDEQARLLSEKFVELGFPNTLYMSKSHRGVRGYWRIRLNKDSAESFFSSIRHLVPEVLQYKLPSYHRGFYEGFPETSVTPQIYDDFVEVLECSCNGPLKKVGRYDITTTTSNFFANHILVHNSGRTSYSIPPEIEMTVKQKLSRSFQKSRRKMSTFLLVMLGRM
jgi:hypothetical protein